MKNGLATVLDETARVIGGIQMLASTRVMAGVPADRAPRDDEDGRPINNAELAYIHNNGAPEVGIPQRQFMEPGIQSVQGRIEDRLRMTAVAASEGKLEAADRGFHQAGLIAQSGIRAKLTEGVPPPLAPSTVAARIRRVKGKKRRAKIDADLASGIPASRQNGAEGVFTPLIVTGQLRSAINYVVRRARPA